MQLLARKKILVALGIACYHHSFAHWHKNIWPRPHTAPKIKKFTLSCPHPCVIFTQAYPGRVPC